MEWNLKSPATSSWDFSELHQQQEEQEAFSSAVNSTVNGGRSAMALFGAGRSDDQEFSVDLKLGNRTAAAKALKRSRGSSNGGGQAVASCLVDGCTADLSECRDYHRRHKVCEIHSKTPKVTIDGKTQRFCQQCSRFHGLEEFDEGKRSCRKRLDGHNRRRRKPQPEPFPRYGPLPSNYQGNQMVPFSSALAYPSSSGPGWPNNNAAVVKTEPDSGIQTPFPLFHQAPGPPPEIVPHFSRAFPLSPEADRPRFSAAAYDKSLTTTLNSERAFSLLSSPQMGLGEQQNDNHYRRNDISSMSSSSFSMSFQHLHQHNHHHHHHLGSESGTGNAESHPSSSSFPSHWGHV